MIGAVHAAQAEIELRIVFIVVIHRHRGRLQVRIAGSLVFDVVEIHPRAQAGLVRDLLLSRGADGRRVAIDELSIPIASSAHRGGRLIGLDVTCAEIHRGLAIVVVRREMQASQGGVEVGVVAELLPGLGGGQSALEKGVLSEVELKAGRDVENRVARPIIAGEEHIGGVLHAGGSKDKQFGAVAQRLDGVSPRGESQQCDAWQDEFVVHGKKIGAGLGGRAGGDRCGRASRPNDWRRGDGWDEGGGGGRRVLGDGDGA